MSAFEVLQELHEDGLHDDVEALGSLLVTIDRNSNLIFTPSERYQVLVWYADALRESKQFRKAELTYEQALQLKRSALRKRQQEDITPQVEVQCRIVECLLGRREFKLAITSLEAVPVKQRTMKMNMMLAKLYHSQSNDCAAISSYKRVLKVNPYALTAINALLELNVKAEDVWSIMTPKLHPSMHWLPTYVSATGEIYARNLPKAIASFDSFDHSDHLKNSYDVNINLAKLHYFSGNEPKALGAFERAEKFDKFRMRDMDVYAALLRKQKKEKELEQLSTHLLSLSDALPETWVALGYFYLRGDSSIARCKYVCERALKINPRHVEALLLKAEVTMTTCVLEALILYDEAQRIAPHRFETYRGQVNCYLKMGRMSDAKTAATDATRQLGQNARTYTLRAEVLVKSSQADKAKICLEKALTHDPSYLPAIHALAEIYDMTRNYQAGVVFLQQKVELVGSSFVMHQYLGEFFHKSNEPEHALYHYGIALNFDPSNQKIKQGIQMVEQAAGGDHAYEMEVEDERNSENNDDSDVEAVWSSDN